MTVTTQALINSREVLSDIRTKLARNDLIILMGSGAISIKNIDNSELSSPDQTLILDISYLEAV